MPGASSDSRKDKSASLSATAEKPALCQALASPGGTQSRSIPAALSEGALPTPCVQ
jgi:hypothetical protein